MTSMSTKTILITGATGKQGSAVIEQLLASPESRGLTIFAITRNVDSGSAKKLAAKSPDTIKLIQGDLDDCRAIFDNVKSSINSVFCVSVPYMGFGAKSEQEEVQAKSLVEEAFVRGVEHFVFTSVDRHGPDSDAMDTDVPHFITKANIEKHILKRFDGPGRTWTILRPVAFMENIIPGFVGKVFPTAWQNNLSPTTKLQVVSTQDIGWFGAQALMKPAEYSGQAISLAGDDLTFQEANDIFRNAAGTDMPTTWGFLVSLMLWLNGDLGLMFRFFENTGYAADIQSLRKRHPGLLSFSDWVKSSPFAKTKTEL
ncbi:NmrA-like family domain-containing protein 1-like protein 4 [Phlyctema vagabunda]|uniref:NmrA-like family domain-containing protein 1-like protein 4 n=1 Tax=Phlyctema vagabunda TaxID=108571 RepID=A0ABR4P5U3_9HELO